MYGISLFNYWSDEGVRPAEGGKFTSYQSIILYRKFKADQIFTGQEIIADNQVLITDKSGVIEDILPEAEAGDDIECFKGILTPGFINCHCHLELSHMKSHIPKHTGLVDFVFKIVTERHFEEEEILTAIKNAEQEMMQNGIVAVGDICNNTLTIPQKSKKNIYYHNFIETSGFPPAVSTQRFQRSVDLYDNYSKASLANSIVPHAPYSVSPEMFKMINDFPNNNLLTIHNQEISAENELFEYKSGAFLNMYEKMNIDISFFTPSGKTSLQTYLPYFTKQQTVILVHNVATSAKDIEFITLQTRTDKQQVYYCLCPNANLYISNKLPDVNLFVEQQFDIVLGTDSLASNDQLSILAEINTLRNAFPNLQIASVLQWATMNAAKALGIENEYGSFEKGKKPGVVLIDEDFVKAKRIV